MLRSRALAAVFVSALVCAACGGSGGGSPPPDSGTPDSGVPDSGTPDGGLPDSGSAPTVTLVSPSNGSLHVLDPVVLEFSETMSRQNLQVGGSLVGPGYSAAWTTTTNTDDTLTLTPTSGWSEGTQSLTVDAVNPDGVHGVFSGNLTVLAGNSAGFTQTPSTPTASTSATFAFQCAPSTCSFTCLLDGITVSACSSPTTLAGVSEGHHAFQITADWGGGSTQSATYAWDVDLTAPKLISAAWEGYGQLALTFDERVDPTTGGDASRYSLSPTRPTGLAVTGAAVSGSQVHLTFLPFQLPFTYAVTYSIRDVLGNEATGQTASLPSSDTVSRVAFVSSAHGDGNLLAWSAIPSGANPGTGLQAADAICQAEANAQGFHGTFRAFLSDGSSDAACRMRNYATGQWSNNCGSASAPSSNSGPWIATDGLPLARSVDELSHGDLLRPIARLADGTLVTTAQYAWHATDTSSGGIALANTCSNWTSNAGTSTAASAQADENRLPFRIQVTSSCSAQNALMCFQTDSNGAALNDSYRAQGKVAFVTSTPTTGAFSSNGKTAAAAADDLCQSAASAAGLANPTHFVAWLSTSTADAYCRVLGQQTGKRSDAPACGLTTPPSTGPWVTTTGFAIAANLDALITNGPALPIFATESAGFPSGNAAWTGTTTTGTYSAATCTDWTSTTASGGGTLGLLTDRTKWTSEGAGSCGNLAPLLCMER